MIYWVGYQAFFRYVVLKDRILLRKEIRKDVSSQKADAVDGIPNPKRIEKQENIFRDVDTYIISKKRYLDPYFSLEKLSEELNTGTSSLSKLINTYAKRNFPDYINKMRVEEAKRLLSNPDFSAYTMVAIGLECGFNSKSTFYSAFKKFTGQTPTVYRNL